MCVCQSKANVYEWVPICKQIFAESKGLNLYLFSFSFPLHPFCASETFQILFYSFWADITWRSFHQVQRGICYFMYHPSCNCSVITRLKLARKTTADPLSTSKGDPAAKGWQWIPTNVSFRHRLTVIACFARGN